MPDRTCTADGCDVPEAECIMVYHGGEPVGLACIPHADALMFRLSFTEPEGLAGYYGWRREARAKGWLP